MHLPPLNPNRSLHYWTSRESQRLEEDPLSGFDTAHVPYQTTFRPLQMTPLLATIHYSTDYTLGSAALPLVQSHRLAASLVEELYTLHYKL
jgi:hypothetical protein